MEDTEEILIRYLSGEGTEEDKDAILNRLKTDETFRREYVTLRDAWFGMGLEVKDRREYGEEIGRILCRTVGDISRKLIFIRWIVGCGVAAVVLLSLSIGWLLHDNTQKVTAGEYVEYCAARGERSRIILPDSSVVWLNGDSQIRYAKDFNREERFVKLDGEAYFEVVKSMGCPFIVDVNDVQIKVFGTKFNVSAYGDDEQIVTTLDEGSLGLRLKNPGSPDFVLLAPNEKMTFNRLDQQFRKEPFSETSSWKDGFLTFDRDSLATMVRKIERRYDVKIIVENTRNNDYLYTGTFSDESLQDLLAAIDFLTPADYDIEGKNVRIRFR